MFSVVEIDKTFSYEGTFTTYSPYVYQSIVTVNAGLQVESIATYWTSTFGADGNYNTVATQIESMTLDSIFELTKQDSLVDCQANQNSFYFDATLQVLYIHIAHDDNLFAHTIETGILFGYCSDTVRYFRNQIYRPIVQSIPSLSDQADPLQYGIISFGGGSITFTNDVTDGVGLFDSDEKLYGNPVRIKRGQEGDAYEDLVLVFAGYVKDIETTTATMTLEVGDKRERLEVDTPVAVFSGLTGICEDSNGIIIPDGYGDVIQVPAYPIEIDDTQVTYRWGTLVTSISQLYAIHDDVAIEVGHGDWYLPSKDELNLLYTELYVNGLGSFSSTGDYWSATEIDSSNAWRQYFGNGGQASTNKSTSCKIRPIRAFTSSHTYTVGQPSPSGGFIFYALGSDYKECATADIGSDTWANAVSKADDYDTILNFSTDGTFDLLNSTAYIEGDNTKGLKDIYVTGRMRDYDNPADIIADLNSRVANIEYNTSNYDQTEWTAEKASLADVSLYMDKPKRLYEWIELLQAGSDYGFRYEDTDKITLRVDDKARTGITFSDGTTYIRPIDIRNSDIPIRQNAQLYASSCIVKYSKNHRNGNYSQVVNTSFETDVLKEHRIKKIQTYESLLTNSTDADAKALLVMTDVSEVRPIVDIVIDAEKWLGSSGGDMPRIFDIVNLEASLLTHGSAVPSEWTFILGDTFVLGDDDIILGERYSVTRTEAYTDSRGKRIYAGEMTCQVIGVEPLLETDEIKLRLRKIG